MLTLRPAALAANARRARALAGDARVYAMVKANAYGHGTALALSALSPYVDGFGVAVLDEARTLRSLGCTAPVMLLEGPFDADELSEAGALGLELVVHSLWQLELLAARAGTTPLVVWLKCDTGMHRIGVPPAACAGALSRLSRLPGVTVAGLMTHFACADERDDPLSATQLAALKTLAAQHDLPFTAANSAALCRYPDSHGALVRPGIMLYGSAPLAGQALADQGLMVTQRLAARLIAINTIPAGDSVGYGASWTAQRPSRIGVVAIGYGDGYPRHAPAGTPVAVGGARTGLAGRVSMDMLTIDLTDLPRAVVGDEVELWGDTVSVDEVAAACGTISYELFCQVTARVERRVARP
ncbi:alanine racemase [Alcanivorax limicola]|uniref:alanine racemase n=1 Tax=Alcanivorax limicola TaxID=2874102 RepID=UPI001CBE146C|nr:alanine racemase [Alcanivorax limicola]